MGVGDVPNGPPTLPAPDGEGDFSTPVPRPDAAETVPFPDTVTIAAGDTVKWTNTGFVTHSVTFDPSMAAKAADVASPAGVAPFDSGNVEEDGTFSHTFMVKGTYKYICKFHEAMGMVGTVIVT